MFGLPVYALATLTAFSSASAPLFAKNTFFLFSFYRCDLRQLLRKGHIPLVGYYIKHSMEIALRLFFHRLDNLRL